MKYAQLYWQCRRGCLELDLLLKNYLDHYYMAASGERRAEFVALLELDDEALLPALLVFLDESRDIASLISDK